MKYLCLIYDDERTLAAMPKPEMDAFMGEYMTFTQQIAARIPSARSGSIEVRPVNTYVPDHG